MDIVFKCPNCEQELEVDGDAVGSEITCPTCSTKITVPELGPAAVETKSEGGSPQPPPHHAHSEVHPINPIAASAAAKEEKHFQVPVHDTPAESLIAKPIKPVESATKGSKKSIRVKTIRRIDCVEVGHDRFDEVATAFLDKIGETNVISINTLNYTFLDIGSQKLLTDYGVLVVYRG